MTSCCPVVHLRAGRFASVAVCSTTGLRHDSRVSSGAENAWCEIPVRNVFVFVPAQFRQKTLIPTPLPAAGKGPLRETYWSLSAWLSQFLPGNRPSSPLFSRPGEGPGVRVLRRRQIVFRAKQPLMGNSHQAFSTPLEARSQDQVCCHQLTLAGVPAGQHDRPARCVKRDLGQALRESFQKS